MSLEKKLRERVKKYRSLTKRALSKVKINPENTSGESENARDFIEIAKNYLNDGEYYEKKGELTIALASYSYAHAWIDAGVRSGILKGKGETLFIQPKKTVKKTE